MQQLHSSKTDLYWGNISLRLNLTIDLRDASLCVASIWRTMKWENLVLDVYQVGNGAWAKHKLTFKTEHTHTHTLIVLNCMEFRSRSLRNTQLLSFRWADVKQNCVFKHKWMCICVCILCVWLCAPSVVNCFSYICV